MGTRCLTVMHEDEDDYKGKEIVVMYRQMDGYPEGHGVELRKFLKDIIMVNGISLNESGVIANGGGCLAAQIIAYFKTDVGGFYLHPAGTRGIGEEYIYHVYPSVKNGNVKVVSESVYRGDDTLDNFGKVWYNRDTKGDKMENKEGTKTYPVRYSRTKGEWIPVNEMHPCHILNAMRLELRDADNEEILKDPLFKSYFDVLKDASL